MRLQFFKPSRRATQGRLSRDVKFVAGGNKRRDTISVRVTTRCTKATDEAPPQRRISGLGSLLTAFRSLFSAEKRHVSASQPLSCVDVEVGLPLSTVLGRLPSYGRGAATRPASSSSREPRRVRWRDESDHDRGQKGHRVLLTRHRRPIRSASTIFASDDTPESKETPIKTQTPPPQQPTEAQRVPYSGPDEPVTSESNHTTAKVKQTVGTKSIANQDSVELKPSELAADASSGYDPTAAPTKPKLPSKQDAIRDDNPTSTLADLEGRPEEKAQNALKPASSSSTETARPFEGPVSVSDGDRLDGNRKPGIQSVAADSTHLLDLGPTPPSDNVQPSETPKAVPSSIDTKPKVPSSASIPSTTAAEKAKPRPRSPVRTTTDLSLAAKAFEWNDEADLPPILQNLIVIKERVGIIPVIIQSEVEEVLDRNDEQLHPWMIDNESPVVDVFNAMYELREMQFILHESHYCSRERASEAAWNDAVTSRLLYLALRHEKGVRHHNITTARPARHLVLREINGNQLSGKLVDYSINIHTEHSRNQASAVNLPSHEKAAIEIGDAIRSVISKVPSKTRHAVNQTLYGPVRFNPAGVSIETKSPSSTSDGRAQLASWIASWMHQMKYLRAVAFDPKCEAPEESDMFQQPLGIKMPLIVATGSSWKLHLASDEGNKIVYSSLFAIGDTDSLLGIYTLVKSLRTLAAWTDGPFRQYILAILSVQDKVDGGKVDLEKDPQNILEK